MHQGQRESKNSKTSLKKKNMYFEAIDKNTYGFDEALLSLTKFVILLEFVQQDNQWIMS